MRRGYVVFADGDIARDQNMTLVTARTASGRYAGEARKRPAPALSRQRLPS
ncbi:hypothetical protein [Stenotrophomonas rhizophila]|uniref:Uncharacterized protein n=1 Tax=Stenotrophomonas rhizophila TaxID=216778 RepID=A0AAW5PHU7_9GAMM|nr:hypothetical protein [Stenotrophomonas rhizophila]MCS4280129.1 hypothetical protein [Stenotrophomonas rhizophila]